MKKYTKTAVALAIMLVVSAIGFGTAFGYGGGAGAPIINGLWNGTAALGAGANNHTTPTPVITTSPSSGKVLGVETFVFNIDLGYGMTNSDVTELQTRLTSEGVYTGPISGSFGPLTKVAVKAYQAKKGLPQTGFVGPLTRAALNGTTAPTTTGGANLRQFVELLISIGAISPEKAAAARSAAGL